MKRFLLATFISFSLYATAQPTYTLEVATGQTYTELVKEDYVIPHYTQAFGNIINKQPLSLKAFGTTYNLGNGLLIIIREGYFYLEDQQANRSATFYVAKGDFRGRPGDTSVFSYYRDSATGQFIMQWKNLGFTDGTKDHFLNFQIVLHTQSGIIEYRYGKSNVGADLYIDGEDGPNIGVLEMDYDFNTIFRQLWLKGNPSNPTIETSQVFTHLNSTPEEGTVYKFHPAWPAAVTKLAVPEISIFPNPVTDNQINFSAKDSNPIDVSIFDMAGKQVLSQRHDPSQPLQLNLAPGLYQVNINDVPLKKISITQ